MSLWSFPKCLKPYDLWRPHEIRGRAQTQGLGFRTGLSRGTSEVDLEAQGIRRLWLPQIKEGQALDGEKYHNLEAPGDGEDIVDLEAQGSPRL